MTVTLYGYWRSLASFRVRIALNLKAIAYTETIVDLGHGEQFGATFSRLNPQNALPLLVHDGLSLTQSQAILEYIEECWPQSPLLPSDAAGKARVRSLAQIAIADVHPLIVPRVRNFLETQCELDEAQKLRWSQHWFDRGTAAIEAHLGDGQSGLFSQGDQITLADLALVSHVVGARLFECSIASAPRLGDIAERCLAIKAFSDAHPMVVKTRGESP